MKNKIWICPFLDTIGVIALIGASAALAGAFWFASAIPESVLFNAFHTCLAVAVGSFFISRVAELLKVVVQTPNPRRVRAQVALDEPLAGAMVADDTPDNVTTGKFPRAA